MQQKFFITPFAATGDREPIPNAQQPDGSVSYVTGWGLDYELDPENFPNAKDIPRDSTNALFYDVTQALSAIQREGAPEFITSADNGGSPFPYSRGAYVRWSVNGAPPFRTFISKLDNNTTVPSNAAGWQPDIFEFATQAQYDSQTPGLAIDTTTLRAILASSSVTVPDATTTTKGIQRNATNAEAATPSAPSQTTTTVTPAGLQAAIAAQVPQATATVAGRARFASNSEAGGAFTDLMVNVAQLNTKVRKIGSTDIAFEWVGVKLNFSIDGQAQGSVAVEPWVNAQIATRVRQIGTTNAVGIGWANGQLNVQVDNSPLRSLAFLDGAAFTGQVSAPDFVGTGDGRLSSAGPGRAVGLRPNGAASTDGETFVSPNGNMTVNGTVIATGGFQGSSRTVKRDIRTIPGAEALAIVEALPAVSFEHKPEYRNDGGKRTFGWIAEDMDELLTEAVRHTPEGKSPLVIDPSQPSAVLWAAVGYLAKRVKELEDRQDGKSVP